MGGKRPMGVMGWVMGEIPSEPFRFLLQIVPRGALPTKLPDNALGPKLAIPAWVRAGLAVLETLPAIPHFHLFAPDAGLTVRVVAALHMDLFLPWEVRYLRMYHRCPLRKIGNDRGRQRTRVGTAGSTTGTDLHLPPPTARAPSNVL